MAETRENRDPQYEETTAPQNPPNSMVNPQARKGWLVSSVGLLAVAVLIVGLAFAWVLVKRESGEGRTPDSQAVGTTGAQVRENAPGGFDPAPDHDNTRDELEFRGVGDRPQGPMPGLNADITEAGDVKKAAAGSRVRLTNVAVDRADGDRFWIRAGDTTLEVVAPGGTPTVRGGQQVNVAGTIESNGDAKRIRASRIDVK